MISVRERQAASGGSHGKCSRGDRRDLRRKRFSNPRCRSWSTSGPHGAEPCHAIAPTIEEIAGEYQSKLKVVKLDVEESEEISSRFSVLNIPTLILFRTATPSSG